MSLPYGKQHSLKNPAFKAAANLFILEIYSINWDQETEIVF